MNEEEVGKAGGSRKKLIVGIVVALIVVASVVVWFLKDQGSATAPNPPIIRMSVYETNDSYILNITRILQPDPRVDLQVWTDFNALYYIVANNSPNFGEPYLRTYLNEKTSNEFLAILDANKIVNIVNNTGNNVTYLDRDGDYAISVNDTVIISKALLTGNERRAFFVFIYEGDLDGRLSDSHLIDVDGEFFIWNAERR